MLEKVLISIIMPVYNSENYLVDCVSSILREEFESFELLLIDDGSTDSSPKLCDELAKTDNRIRVFHKGNGGICAARNFGLQHARGEYIAFSDHDDSVYNGFLTENYQLAIDTGADVIKFGRDALIIENDKVVKRYTRRFEKRTLNKKSIIEEFMKLRFDGAMTCVWDGFFKKSFLDTNGIEFNTDYKKGGEDIEFCSNCFAKAEKVSFNDGVFYEHFIRVGYSTSTKPDDQRLNKFKMLKENLILCAEELKIPTEKNELFFLNITKELVYPSMVYFNSIKVPYTSVKRYMKEECDMYRSNTPKITSMVSVDYKWGIYAAMYKYGFYWLMYTLLRIKKKR